MNTRAFQLNHRRLRFQSFWHIVYAFTAATVVNVLCVIVLSSLIEPGPEPTPVKRLHQVQQQEPIKQPVREQEQKAKKQAMEQALPPVPSMAPAQTQHDFTFPGTFLPQLNDADWNADMDLASIAVPQEQISLDKRARLKFIPDLGRFYPRLAKQKGITGYTVLELVINAEGRVESYTIRESVPAGVFEQQVDKVIPHIRYEAAELAGKAHTDKRLFKLTWGIQ